MRKIVRSFVAILAVLVLNGFGFVGHTTAMPMHSMDDMSHEQSSPTTCATLCRTAVIDADKQSRELHEEENEDDDDDEVYFPFYLQIQSACIDCVDTHATACQSTAKPPPKVPIYILHCVSRS